MCIEVYRSQSCQGDPAMPFRIKNNAIEPNEGSNISIITGPSTTFAAPTIYNITSPLVSISLSVPNTESSEMLVPEQLKSTFLAFYTTFIRVGSVLEVNLKWQVRDRIKRQIESGVYRLNIFEEAKEHVLDLIFTNTLPRFLAVHREEIESIERERTREVNYDEPWSIPLVMINLG